MKNSNDNNALRGKRSFGKPGGSHFPTFSPAHLLDSFPPLVLSRAATNSLLLSLALVLAGCASTKVTDEDRLVRGQLPRPNHILVYNFVSTPGEVPGESSLAGKDVTPSTPQTAEEFEMGRQLGAQIAAQLVEEIHGMGMPATQVSVPTTAQLNDIVIRGYLLSIDEGSAAKRIAIGFGSGKSKLTVAVEGYQMTATGLRKLGSGTIDAGGGKSPGAALGLVGFIATANPAGLVISGATKAYGEASGSSKVEGRAKAIAKEIGKQVKERFLEQGWVSP